MNSNKRLWDRRTENVGCLLACLPSQPATCKCISRTDLLRHYCMSCNTEKSQIKLISPCHSGILTLGQPVLALTPPKPPPPPKKKTTNKQPKQKSNNNNKKWAPCRVFTRVQLGPYAPQGSASLLPKLSETSKVSARTSCGWVGSRVHIRSSEDVTSVRIYFAGRPWVHAPTSEVSLNLKCR